jgi:hypothetical protein
VCACACVCVCVCARADPHTVFMFRVIVKINGDNFPVIMRDRKFVICEELLECYSDEPERI